VNNSLRYAVSRGRIYRAKCKRCEQRGRRFEVDLQISKCSMLQENNPDAAFMYETKKGRGSVASYWGRVYRYVLRASRQLQLLKLLCEWIYFLAGKISISSFRVCADAHGHATFSLSSTLFPCLHCRVWSTRTF